MALTKAMVRSLAMSDTLEYTLAIIKPEVMDKKCEILRTFIRCGFHILAKNKFQLSPEQAADFYRDKEKTRGYMFMVLNLSNGPIEAVILAKENAIAELQILLGPERPSVARQVNCRTLRAIYGDEIDEYRNAFHGSTCPKTAEREIHFFYPNFVVDPIAKNEPQKLCCQRTLITNLMNGLTKTINYGTEDPLEYLGKWLRQNNPGKPTIADGPASQEIPYKPQKDEVEEQRPPCELPMEIPCRKEDSKSTIFSFALPKKVREESTTSTNSTKSLIKAMCCCDIKVNPGKSLICPICHKLVTYSVPMKDVCSNDSSTSNMEDGTKRSARTGTTATSAGKGDAGGSEEASISYHPSECSTDIQDVADAIKKVFGATECERKALRAKR